MIISHQKKFIFVHIPKAAGTSISGVAIRYADGQNLQKPGTKHEDLRSFLARNGETDFSGYFKFAFVRNPWDRMVSFFHYMKMYAHEAPPQAQALRDFKHFMAELEAGAPWLMRTHSVRPQADFITDADGNMIVDFVGRFENLRQDVETIMAKLDLGFDDAGMPHQRSSGGTSRQHYADFYDDATRAVIAQLYAADIDLLGYRFDPNPDSADAPAATGTGS